MKSDVHLRAELEGKRPRSSIRSRSDLPDATGARMSGTRWGRYRSHDILDGARPFYLPERRMGDKELFPRNDSREQNRHGPAVLAGRSVNRDQGAASNQPSTLARNGDIAIGHGVDPRLDGMCRLRSAAPRSGLYASTGPRRAPPSAGSSDGGSRSRGDACRQPGGGESPCGPTAERTGRSTGREELAAFAYKTSEVGANLE